MKISNGEVEIEPMSLTDTLVAVQKQNIRLELIDGKLRIRTACDVKTEVSIKAHESHMQKIAFVVQPQASEVPPEPATEPSESTGFKCLDEPPGPKPDAHDPYCTGNLESVIHQDSGLTEEQAMLADNRRALYGIQEVFDCILQLEPDYLREQLTRIERASGRSERWSCITDVFADSIAAWKAGDGPGLPLDEVPF